MTLDGRGGTILAGCLRYMSWFDVADGRLCFRRRITTQPVLEYVASEDGRRAVDAAASRIRFSLLGRTRAARRRMCRELRQALNAPSVHAAVAAECDRYVAAWAQLAYAPSLPRLNVALQRLVVVPRAMIPGRALSGVSARVAASFGMAGVSDPFKAFFSRWILSSMDAAVGRAGPSPRRPVHAHESWACVAHDREFIWVDPLWSGPEWRGHVVMFEMPAPCLGRGERRELEAAIERLTQSLANLTRLQRDSTVRLAADQMGSLNV